MRDEDSIKQAFEAQASSADESRELCDIFGLDSGGRHDDRRDRLLSLLSGPPSRRRIGWLDLLLQVHAAGAQSFDELEPSDLEAAVLDDGDGSFDVAAFQPHILRSASMRAAIDAGEAVDAVLQRASVSLKVFKVYYDLPKGGESSGGVESLDGEAAARLLLDLQPRSVPSPPVSRAQPLLANG